MDVNPLGRVPIRFQVNPNKDIAGHIIVYKGFNTPVDALTFSYKQNWDNKYFVFQVEADDKVVKTIDKYAGYSERITLNNLNAKK